ncbi:DUF742 domain-containing protein [Streptomyces sp. NPDC002730]|uniref:DUF742 domain-containing protein n=1 Tax=Streptomyces sp. NPDC002730 TaxID=3364662 RepID=UPI00369D07A9
MTPSDGDGQLVRLFTLVGGRTQPSHDVFTLITLITTVQLPAPNRALPPEHRRILQLCTVATAVAEIAAHLDLPVSVTAIMLSDLMDHGMITARPPACTTGLPDIDLLRKVRDGLVRL